MLLPVGVGIQMVDDAVMTGTGPSATASDDRYIGFNTRVGTTDLKVPVGGIILFDQGGRLVSRRYGFHVSRAKVTGTKATGRELTDLGRLVFGENASPPTTDVIGNFRAGAEAVPRTQFGFVLYDEESFRNLFSTPNDPYGEHDPQFTGGGQVGASSPEGKEEKWLDDNALPVLINRYNGTLIRGQ